MLVTSLDKNTKSFAYIAVASEKDPNKLSVVKDDFEKKRSMLLEECGNTLLSVVINFAAYLYLRI